jgi:NAD(P)-dependent dehydrogenase (short-subunit alcohol dehydrogenase family)
MRELGGKTAFVTGGASGFGLALAGALLEEGMKVAIGDLTAEKVSEAVAALSPRGEVEGLVCDVTSRASLAACAEGVVRRFGGAHLICNNAGVLAPNPMSRIEPGDWRWSFDVNVMGTLHGVAAFLPVMRAQAEGGWFLNTASMAGLRGLAGAGAYSATKAAVISISESLAAELVEEGIGVTVLCPGFMRTQLHRSSLRRPDAFGGAKMGLVDPSAGDPDALPAAIQAGIPAEHVAARAIAGVKSSALYVVTHPALRDSFASKSGQLLAAYDLAAVEDAAVA